MTGDSLLFQLGYTLWREKRKMRGVRCEIWKNCNGSNKGAATQMAILYGLLGETDRAFACLERSVPLSPAPPSARQRATQHGLPSIRPAPPRNAGKVEFAA